MEPEPVFVGKVHLQQNILLSDDETVVLKYRAAKVNILQRY